MAYGYNLGLETAKLHEDRYNYSMATCNTRQDRIEENEENLAILQDLLHAISVERQKDKKRIDLSHNPEVIDAAREICPPGLLPEGVYAWNTEDQITILVDGLNSLCGQITRKISPEMMLLIQEMQEVAEVAKIGADSLKVCREENQRYISNQRAGA